MNLWTSREVSNMAHDSVKPHKGTMASKIVGALFKSPMTDDELEVLLGMSHQSVSAGRRGLVKKGVVEPTGELRPTRSGRQAQVWRIKDGDDL